MIKIPNICPVNFIKEEDSDYKTVFPNETNTHIINRLMNPRWYLKIPLNTSFTFLVWVTTDTSLDAYLTKGSADITQSTVIILGDDSLKKITLTATSLDDIEIKLEDDDDVYVSNTIKVVSNFQDEVDEWALVEYTNNRTAFDYYFDGLDPFRVWIKISDQDDDNGSSVSTYEDDGDKLTVTRSDYNESLILETSPQDRWFSKKLANIFLCSDIKINGIEYTPEGEATITKLNDGVYQSSVEVALQKK